MCNLKVKVKCRLFSTFSTDIEPNCEYTLLFELFPRHNSFIVNSNVWKGNHPHIITSCFGSGVHGG